jgi:hypothetical protein
MQVYVTARGTSYHKSPECTAVTSAHKAALTMGANPQPAIMMSLEEAIARKPEIKECKACAHMDTIEAFDNERAFDNVEVRFEIGFGAAATTAKGYLSIPREAWLAILPEDREVRIMELIKQQAARQLQVSYLIVE